ncbi:winged helix DNA-binding protein [Cribrihabitans neustonicus]|uniref:winged helix DNA-binding protein n=1 Tax=Cribrihabitans neustonicus TaxID=1429085 RepID=UPI003B5B0728
MDDMVSEARLNAEETAVRPADGESLAQTLNALELAVHRAREGLVRWQADCMAGAAVQAATGAEVTLLVLLAERGEQGSSVKEMARQTNRADIPNIQYSLRKLAAAGLVEKHGAGRSGVTYHLSEQGAELAAAYSGLRASALLPLLEAQPDLARGLAAAAEVLDALAVLYGAAGRAAAAQQTR